MKRLIMIIWLLVMLFITALGAKPGQRELTCAGPMDRGPEAPLCRSAAD